MHRIADRIAKLFAQLGGLVLLLLVLLTCASVLGRSLNSILHGSFAQEAAPGVAAALLSIGVGPINGDFEIVEAGMAFVVFAFMPLCQLNAAHAKVDVFTAILSKRVNRGLRAVIEAVFAAVLVLIAVQLTRGMISKMESGQTTLLLQFPVWWSYAASVAAAAAAALIGTYVALTRVAESISGRAVSPSETEATH